MFIWNWYMLANSHTSYRTHHKHKKWCFSVWANNVDYGSWMHTLKLVTLNSSSLGTTNELNNISFRFIPFIHSFILLFIQCSMFNVQCSKFTIGIRSLTNAIYQVECLPAIPTRKSKPYSFPSYFMVPTSFKMCKCRVKSTLITL